MNREILKHNFEKHDFQVTFFDTKEEASKYILEQIHDTTVATGGSMTLKAMGLDVELAKTNKYYSHTSRDDIEEFKNELTAEYFICSANGVAETGYLVNTDGSGNRIAGTLYGHRKTIFVVGRNKIVPTLEEALERDSNIASPPNWRRLNKKTPCAVTDKCSDCDSPDRICKATVIYKRALTHAIQEIVFIDEDLGF